ncbi:MAG: hypothetical protein P0Y50_04870 [Candidatus Brevundimonas colombiensis]|uniref:Phosphodiesterase n=1 Tax=Candidatus Brevundimonas colombiensis TaxID=3121376 RepID=A0AAJ5X0W9_9CAUL|nr:hypothetical protein [Brevundimonas sp.]WEK40944.1 MAG: hypothetical protein P0Y50_04870 [Brevundimonas sp.]
MLILSHRGYWREAEEKNAWVAFERTVSSGYGTETDVRDLNGELVVSHDPPMAGARRWVEVVALFRDSGLPLAVNIKADGLSSMLAEAFADSGIDWFAFDMSGPETVRYARAGLPFFTRHSDIEPEPALYAEANGVWLDAFTGHDWITPSVIQTHLDNGKRVCLVSPELHGRAPDPFWSMIEPLAAVGNDALMLCTDTPDDAKARFPR